MGYVSTLIGDRFSALLVSLMALGLTLVDQNLFQPFFKAQASIELALLQITFFCLRAFMNCGAV